MSTIVTPKRIWLLSGAFWLVAVTMVALYGLLGFGRTDPNNIGAALPAISHQPQLYCFQQTKSLTDAMQSPAFTLAAIDRPLRLPDLRALLVVYGVNERPDRALMGRKVQFGLRGNPSITPVKAGEKVYFKFDHRTNKWSIADEPTPLSATFTPSDPTVEVRLELKDERGESVKTPSEFHKFSLTPVPMPPTTQPDRWSLGELVVDTSLLERQGAAWWGQDEVVRAFGGEEMANEADRERVQFGSGPGAYVLWFAENDCFVFDDEQWKAVRPGKESVGKPLLQVKQIDGRVIHCMLWNTEGSSRHAVDLARRGVGGEIKIPDMKIIGARSKRQWIVEIQGKRITLIPDDWIVLNSDGLVPLNSPDLLNDYINGIIVGDLFAFSGIEQINGELCLTGTFYDSTRTRQEPFAVSLYRSWSPAQQSVDNSASSDDEDEDDDENEEFDDDDVEFDEDDNEDD
jgi:hypothetical protein